MLIAQRKIVAGSARRSGVCDTTNVRRVTWNAHASEPRSYAGDCIVNPHSLAHTPVLFILVTFGLARSYTHSDDYIRLVAQRRVLTASRVRTGLWRRTFWD